MENKSCGEGREFIVESWNLTLERIENSSFLLKETIHLVSSWNTTEKGKFFVCGNDLTYWNILYGYCEYTIPTAYMWFLKAGAMKIYDIWKCIFSSENFLGFE